MQQLTQQEISQVSGGDGFNLIFVSVNIPNPNMSPGVTNLVTRLMNGQMDAATFAQALNEAGGSLVQYMTVVPSCQGPFMGPIPQNCLPPFNNPPFPPMP